MHEVTGYTISAMPHLQKLRGTENVNGKNIYSDKSVARKITLKSPTVKGDYSYYTSAPSGTPNFPRPTGHNGAFDCEWIQDYNQIIIEVKGVSTSKSMDLGKFTFIYNTIES